MRTKDLLRIYFKDKQNWFQSALLLVAVFVSVAQTIFDFPSDRVIVPLLSLLVIEHFITYAFSLETIKARTAAIEPKINAIEIQLSDVLNGYGKYFTPAESHLVYEGLVDKGFSDLKGEIFVLGANLGFLAKYFSKFDQLNSNISIRLLMLNPDCKECIHEYRKMHNRVEEGYIEASIRNHLYIKKMLSRQNVEIRVVDVVTPMAYVAFDISSQGTIIARQNLVDEMVNNCPHIAVKQESDSFLYDVYKSQIERLWSMGVAYSG